MSSSQQQSTNSNNNQPQNTHPLSRPPEIPPNYQYNDYEDDPSLTLSNNSNVDVQTLYMNDGNFYDPTGEQYHNDYLNQYVNEGYNDNDNDDANDDDIPKEIIAALNEREEMILNEQLNDEDEAVYDDDVQNAFENYENEYSKYWKQNESTWNGFPNDEQNEILEQMRECMRYMSQEYSTAEMPNNLVERAQESSLNPDAVEFRPSWSPPSTSTDNEAIVVTSWIPCEAKKEEGDKKDF